MSSQLDGPNIPEPADPHRRREPLPWHLPKPAAEDPLCPGKLERIVNGRSYIPAIEDVEFLDSDDARGMRLQLDYAKPEKLLRAHGVESTIVVFGSTRIAEPVAVARRVAELREALEQAPGDVQLERRLRVAESVEQKCHYYEIARDFGRLVANAGEGPHDSRLVIMTGGGPGLMEAANRGAHDAGGKSIGLNIALPHPQYPNPYITPDLCFQFHYFSIRKLHFLLRARALIAFPGGYGTLDELFETLNLIQTRKMKPVPVVLVGEAFWRKVFDIDFLVDEGVIDFEDRELFWFAESADQIWQGLQSWYQRKGETLIEVRS